MTETLVTVEFALPSHGAPLRSRGLSAPILCSRMVSPRYIAGFCARMLKVGAPWRRSRCTGPIFEGHLRRCHPSDDERRERHGRVVPAGMVSAPDPKPRSSLSELLERWSWACQGLCA